MTESEWLACEDTKPMLESLREKASDRKLCLFAVWCCRSIWPHLSKSGRRIVEITERFLEGRSRQATLNAACVAANDEFEETPENTIEHFVTLAASLVAVNDVE